MVNKYKEDIKRRVSKALRKIMQEKGFLSYDEMYRTLVRKGFNKSFACLYDVVAKGTDRLSMFLYMCKLLDVDGIRLLNEEVLNG